MKKRATEVLNSLKQFEVLSRWIAFSLLPPDETESDPKNLTQAKQIVKLLGPGLLPILRKAEKAGAARRARQSHTRRLAAALMILHTRSTTSFFKLGDIAAVVGSTEGVLSVWRTQNDFVILMQEAGREFASFLVNTVSLENLRSSLAEIRTLISSMNPHAAGELYDALIRLPSEKVSTLKLRDVAIEISVRALMRSRGLEYDEDLDWRMRAIFATPWSQRNIAADGTEGRDLARKSLGSWAHLASRWNRR
jgi:hypothetical protein